MKWILTIASIFLLVSACEEQEIQTPVADFSFVSTGNQEVYGTEVVFTNLSRKASSYVWDFGDGFRSYEPSPSHEYLVRGTYTITLSAVGLNQVSSVSQQLTITNDLIGVWLQTSNYTTNCADNSQNHQFSNCTLACEKLVISPTLIESFTGDSLQSDRIRYEITPGSIKILGYNSIAGTPFLNENDAITYFKSRDRGDIYLQLFAQRSATNGGCLYSVILKKKSP